MDAHHPGHGGREEELELPRGRETLTVIGNGEGGGEGVGVVGECWEERQKWRFLHFNKL